MSSGTILPARTSLVAALSLAFLAVAWGAIPLIVREDVPASHLVAARVTLGATALVLFLAATRRLRLPATQRGRLLASGLILAIHWGTFFLAIKLTTVAVALAVVYLGPVLAALLSGPLLGERAGAKVWIGLGLALIGTLLVVRPGSGATLEGVGLALLAAASFAALIIVTKPAASSLGGLTVATWELVVASVVLLPFTVRAVQDSLAFWPQFLLLGALFTGVSLAIYWWAVARLAVPVVSVITYLEPASAAVWAALVLDERPGAATWLGVILVVAGGTLAALEAAEEKASDAATPV